MCLIVCHHGDDSNESKWNLQIKDTLGLLLEVSNALWVKAFGTMNSILWMKMNSIVSFILSKVHCIGRTFVVWDFKDLLCLGLQSIF